jgi:cell division protein FtsI (penicillin-binding protein 3)
MEPKEQIFARMYVVITLVSLLPILVAFQVLNISVLQGTELREQVEVQSTSAQPIPASRGLIYDVNGRALAVNVEQYDIYIDPSIKGYEEGIDPFLNQLSAATGKSVNAFKIRIRSSGNSRYINLVKNAMFSKKNIDHFDELPFVIIEKESRRSYTYGQAAAHVVGFMGTDVGLTGLELQFNEALSGTPGRKIVRKDARGRAKPIPGSPRVDPVHGNSLVLTLDLHRQAILEEELEKGAIDAGASWASAIAVDVNTGAILAMANYPTFDLNQGASAAEFQKRNHAITDLIEPGSTMKMLPALTALESGVVSMNEIIDTGDTGTMIIDGRPLTDTHAYGKISFSQVIQKSSNIGTALVAQRTEKGEFYKQARNLGFNQPTYIELPGEASTKISTIDRWSRSTHSAMSRGYGISASPLQITLAYAALANGGLLMKPYIVKEILDPEGRVIWEAQVDSVRRAFLKETAQTLIPAFESVVSLDGTAEQARIPGLRIAGKTGTAKTSNGRGYSNRDYRATFVGFYPVEKPQVVMLVLMDAPRKSIYGGIVAAPVFKKSTERWLASMPEVAAYVKPDTVLMEQDWAKVPLFSGQPSALAQRTLQASGLEGNSSASFDDTVFQQAVLPGAKALLGTPVKLISRLDSVRVMPNLTGLSTRDAVSWLRKLEVDVEIEGHGMVRSQWPPPGSELPEMATLKSK